MDFLSIGRLALREGIHPDAVSQFELCIPPGSLGWARHVETRSLPSDRIDIGVYDRVAVVGSIDRFVGKVWESRRAG